MSALSDALDHSQAKALAALFKAYTRRDDDPDDEMFGALMRGAGLDDDVQIGFLLRCWRIMRENPEPLPATNGAKPAEPQQVVEDRRWTGGKHKGVPLADTPADYLEWASGGLPVPIGRAAAQEELQRRAEGVPF
jgi:hypothetical protein